MTAFECEARVDFLHLMMTLRETEASRYTERDTPIFVGPLEDIRADPRLARRGPARGVRRAVRRAGGRPPPSPSRSRQSGLTSRRRVRASQVDVRVAAAAGIDRPPARIRPSARRRSRPLLTRLPHGRRRRRRRRRRTGAPRGFRARPARPAAVVACVLDVRVVLVGPEPVHLGVGLALPSMRAPRWLPCSIAFSQCSTRTRPKSGCAVVRDVSGRKTPSTVVRQSSSTTMPLSTSTRSRRRLRRSARCRPHDREVALDPPPRRYDPLDTRRRPRTQRPPRRRWTSTPWSRWSARDASNLESERALERGGERLDGDHLEPKLARSVAATSEPMKPMPTTTAVRPAGARTVDARRVGARAQVEDALEPRSGIGTPRARPRWRRAWRRRRSGCRRRARRHGRERIDAPPVVPSRSSIRLALERFRPHEELLERTLAAKELLRQRRALVRELGSSPTRTIRPS